MDLEISIRALEITPMIVVFLGFPFSFALGFTAGKFRGAKDGIDYCFSRYDEKAKELLYKDKEDKDAKKKERRDGNR